MKGRAHWLVVCGLFAFAWACETYDPPPEVTLRIPAEGKWFLETPLSLEFTEPIAPESLALDFWPCNPEAHFDREGELLDTVEPIRGGCTTTAGSCDGITVAVAEDGLSATVTHSEVFTGELMATPLCVDARAGLEDLAGRQRKVLTRMAFQINPAVAQEPVEIELETGVMAMFSDMTDTMPGVYLRMFVDLGIDKETGTVLVAGTVAQQVIDQEPNSTDPLSIGLYNDERGWTIFLQGTITELPSGGYFLQTEPFLMEVKVLGIIGVRLEQLRLEATVTPGNGTGERDFFEGIMLADKALLVTDPVNPDDLGQAAARTVAFGLRADELPTTPWPRLCAEVPCLEMKEEGGDCQLPEPWTPPAHCE